MESASLTPSQTTRYAFRNDSTTGRMLCQSQSRVARTEDLPWSSWSGCTPPRGPQTAAETLPGRASQRRTRSRDMRPATGRFASMPAPTAAIADTSAAADPSGRQSIGLAARCAPAFPQSHRRCRFPRASPTSGSISAHCRAAQPAHLGGMKRMHVGYDGRPRRFGALPEHPEATVVIMRPIARSRVLHGKQTLAPFGVGLLPSQPSSAIVVGPLAHDAERAPSLATHRRKRAAGSGNRAQDDIRVVVLVDAQKAL